MGDRVAIIGGHTPGRDHFPWPVENMPSSGAYPSQYFPLSLSLTDAMRWVWRVKEWNLTGTLHFDVTFGGETRTYNVVQNLILRPYLVDPPFDISRESQLVLLYGVAAFSGYQQITGGFEDGSVEFFENGIGLLDSSYPSMRYDGGGLYPEVDFVSRIDGNTNLVDPDSSFSIKFTLRNPDEDAIGDSLVLANGIELDGNVLDLHYQIGDVGTAVVSNVSGSQTLAAAEYWPYATKSGAPVYDTATGAQLRDPLS